MPTKRKTDKRTGDRPEAEQQSAKGVAATPAAKAAGSDTSEQRLARLEESVLKLAYALGFDPSGVFAAQPSGRVASGASGGKESSGGSKESPGGARKGASARRGGAKKTSGGRKSRS
jgi:hypothetical protein